MSGRWIRLLLLIIGGLILVFIWTSLEEEKLKKETLEQDPIPEKQEGPRILSTEEQGVEPESIEKERERSPLADELHSSEHGEMEDLKIVHTLIDHYISFFHGAPTGTHQEIIQQLTGKNGRGLAPLPSDHSAINREGFLIDRNGFPYQFHNLSRYEIEIRATGPDRKHWTSDDLIYLPNK